MMRRAPVGKDIKKAAVRHPEGSRTQIGQAPCDDHGNKEQDARYDKRSNGVQGAVPRNGRNANREKCDGGNFDSERGMRDTPQYEARRSGQLLPEKEQGDA